jgi:hypothetical protein
VVSIVATLAASTTATTAALAWAMLVSARIRPAGLAWPVILATPFFGLFLALLFAALDAEGMVIVLFPWAPLMDDDLLLPQIIAVLVYGGFTLVAFTVLSARLRKWATAGL